jgi:hypothetical protein
MSEERGFSRETFLYLAERAGLDIDDPHMEELYAYVKMILPRLKGVDESDIYSDDTDNGRFYAYAKRILPKLKTLDELDLDGVELAVTFKPSRSQKDE